MKLWLVKRPDDWDWDEHDAAVIRAETEEQVIEIAKKLSLGRDIPIIEELEANGAPGIILASFKAG